jgi:hypothetical protein
MVFGFLYHLVLAPTPANLQTLMCPFHVFDFWDSLPNDPSANLNTLVPFARGIYKAIHILKDVKFSLSNRGTTFNFNYSWKFQRKLFKEHKLVTAGTTVMDPQFVICIYWCSSYI